MYIYIYRYIWNYANESVCPYIGICIMNPRYACRMWSGDDSQVNREVK